MCRQTDFKRFLVPGTPQSRQWKLSLQFAHEPILFTLHLAAFGCGLVIEAQKVQDAMHNVSHDFGLPISSITSRLPRGFFDANKHIPDQEGRAALLRIVKCDYVGRACMLKMGFVQQSDFVIVHQMNAENIFRTVDFPLQQEGDDLSQQP